MVTVVRPWLGKKRSRFLKAYLQSGLKNPIGIKASFEVTDAPLKCEVFARRQAPYKAKVHNDLQINNALIMFAIVHMSDVVRIPPNRLTHSLKDAAIQILKEKYESMISPDVGYVIMITDADTSSVGKLVAGDGATYHKVTFKALTFYPKLQEIVEGEVVEITDFGAFVRIGPTDALLHLSQITDDYLKSDVKQGVIVANQTARSLKIGSKLRARITAVSLGKGAGMGKIGITCRQPFLGAVEWIAEEIKKAKGGDKDKEKPAAAPKEKKGEKR